MMENEKLVKFLKVCGGILIGIGIIATLGLLIEFSQGGLFSSSGLDVQEVIIAIIVGFYQVVQGALCFGVAKAIETSDMTYYYVKKGSSEKAIPTKKKDQLYCSRCARAYEADPSLKYCEICGGELLKEIV